MTLAPARLGHRRRLAARLLRAGAVLRRRAGQSTSEFFASGRAVPWWLAGLSMVATTFSSDTPNLVTDIVRRNGVAGNWVWWAFVLTGVVDGVLLRAAVAAVGRADRPRVLRDPLLGHAPRASCAASARSTSGCSSTA